MTTAGSMGSTISVSKSPIRHSTVPKNGCQRYYGVAIDIQIAPISWTSVDNQSGAGYLVPTVNSYYVAGNVVNPPLQDQSDSVLQMLRLKVS